MARFTDGKRIVEITMTEWTDGVGPGVDWSGDFFNVGNLPYDEDKGEYTVGDVQYVIDQAKAWEDGDSDVNPNPTGKEYVIIYEVELMNVTVTFKDGSEKNYRCRAVDLDLGQMIIDDLERETGEEIDTDGTDFWHTDEDGEQHIVASVERLTI